MSVFILSRHNSIASQYLAELRDTGIQNDRMRFRRNVERIGEVLAYEISRQSIYKNEQVVTPLGTKECSLLVDQPIIITILRAGVPFFEGFINIFDKADAGFIGAYRGNYDEKGDFDIEMGYKALPDLTTRTIIVADPMLATGKSLLKAINTILQYGKPGQIHVAALIAAEQGLKYLQQNLPSEVKYWIGDLDKELNNKSYIVPGLGDAGDLCYGKKV
ncbi:uracil phosphoribosyltransferase [Bacteroidota bacterium]